MINLRPYLHIIRTSAKEDSANTKRIVVATLLALFRIGIIAAIYKVAYSVTQPEVLSYENAVWCLAMYTVFIINLGLRNLFKVVNREVVSGDLEVGVLKPINWRLAKVCYLLGKNGVEFIVQLIVMPIFLLLIVGPPDVSYFTLPVILAFVLLIPLAMITAAALFLTIGLAAFWLNDATSLFRVIDKTVLVFGGAFVPIALLPLAAQLFVRYSPFGVYAAPTQLFSPAIVPVLLPTLISAVVWSIALIAICEFVWRRAERRVEVNGG